MMKPALEVPPPPSSPSWKSTIKKVLFAVMLVAAVVSVTALALFGWAAGRFVRAMEDWEGMESWKRRYAKLPALHRAVHDGRVEEVRRLLGTGADPYLVDDDRHTAIHYLHVGYRRDPARPSEGEQILALFLQSGMRADDGRVDWEHVLDDAAEFGRLAVIESLAARGARLAGPDGVSALFQAVSYDRHEVAKFLVEHGTPLNGIHAFDKQTVLHQVRSARMVDLLIDHGANPGARDGSGRTPLEKAMARTGFEEVAAALRRRGGGPLNRDSRAPR